MTASRDDFDLEGALRDLNSLVVTRREQLSTLMAKLAVNYGALNPNVRRTGSALVGIWRAEAEDFRRQAVECDDDGRPELAQALRGAADELANMCDQADQIRGEEWK